MKHTLPKFIIGFILLAFIFNSCFKDELLKEIDDLRGELTTMQKRNDSLNNVLNVRADSLSKALASAQKRSDSLSNVLKTKSDSLSTALGITNANLASLSKSVDSIKTQIVFINGQLTQLNTQLTTITTQLASLNQQLAALGGNVSQLAAQYQALSASLQTINAQIAALQAEQLKLLAQLNAILLQLNPPVDITTGLVAYYPFNGNAGDSSGNGNHGTVIGATLTTDRFGKNQNGYLFNGISDYIQLPLLSRLNNSARASFSFWIKSPNTSGAIIGHNSNNNGGVGINTGFTISYIDAISTDNYSGCCGSISNGFSNIINNWVNVIVLFDGTLANNERVKFYLNGVLSNNVPGTVNSTIGPATSSFIGRRNIDFNRFGAYFGGNLDDIRIYNRILTQSEITYLATN